MYTFYLCQWAIFVWIDKIMYNWEAVIRRWSRISLVDYVYVLVCSHVSSRVCTFDRGAFVIYGCELIIVFLFFIIENHTRL